VTRGAPYYTIIQEFFPEKIHEFVDSSHTCKCNQCGKDMEQLSAAVVEPVAEIHQEEEKQPVIEQQQLDAEMREE
jgi:hypothetical protein